MLASCLLGNSIVTSSERQDHTIRAILRIQKECDLSAIAIKDVNVSHLIVGPDLMDLRLQNVQILHLNDFSIVKMSDGGVESRGEAVAECPCLLHVTRFPRAVCHCNKVQCKRLVIMASFVSDNFVFYFLQVDPLIDRLRNFHWT